MVAFTVLIQKLWELAGTYELYFCHSVNQDSMVGIPRGVWGVLELYSVEKNLLEHFALTGGGAGGSGRFGDSDANNSLEPSLAPEAPGGISST